MRQTIIIELSGTPRAVKRFTDALDNLVVDQTSKAGIESLSSEVLDAKAEQQLLRAIKRLERRIAELEADAQASETDRVRGLFVDLFTAVGVARAAGEPTFPDDSDAGRLARVLSHLEAAQQRYGFGHDQGFSAGTDREAARDWRQFAGEIQGLVDRIAAALEAESTTDLAERARQYTAVARTALAYQATWGGNAEQRPQARGALFDALHALPPEVRRRLGGAA